MTPSLVKGLQRDPLEKFETVPCSWKALRLVVSLRPESLRRLLPPGKTRCEGELSALGAGRETACSVARVSLSFQSY